MKVKFSGWHVLAGVGVLVIVGGSVAANRFVNRVESKWLAVQDRADQMGFNSLTVYQIFNFTKGTPSLDSTASRYKIIVSEIGLEMKKAKMKSLASVTMHMGSEMDAPIPKPYALYDPQFKGQRVSIDQFLTAQAPRLQELKTLSSQDYAGVTAGSDGGPVTAANVELHYSDLSTLAELAVMDGFRGGELGDASRFGDDMSTAIRMANQLSASRSVMSAMNSYLIIHNVCRSYIVLLLEGKVNPALAQGFIQASQLWKEPNCNAIYPGSYQFLMATIDTIQTKGADQVLGTGIGNSIPITASIALRTNAGRTRFRTILTRKILDDYQFTNTAMSNPKPVLMEYLNPHYAKHPIGIEEVAQEIYMPEAVISFPLDFKACNWLSGLDVLSQAMIDQASTGKSPTTLPWPPQLKYNSAAFLPATQISGFPANFSGTLAPKSYPNLPPFQYNLESNGFMVSFPSLASFGTRPDTKLKLATTHLNWSKGKFTVKNISVSP